MIDPEAGTTPISTTPQIIPTLEASTSRSRFQKSCAMTKNAAEIKVTPHPIAANPPRSTIKTGTGGCARSWPESSASKYVARERKPIPPSPIAQMNAISLMLEPAVAISAFSPVRITCGSDSTR